MVQRQKVDWLWQSMTNNGTLHRLKSLPWNQERHGIPWLWRRRSCLDIYSNWAIKKKPGCLGYIVDYTTQLIRDPYSTTSIMECQQGFERFSIRQRVFLQRSCFSLASKLPKGKERGSSSRGFAGGFTRDLLNLFPRSLQKWSKSHRINGTNGIFTYMNRWFWVGKHR